MKYTNYYVAGKNGRSNCVIRSLCKLFSEEYDNVYDDLCNIAKQLNCISYNDVEVFESYMQQRNMLLTEYGKDMQIKDLVLTKERYAIFCWDRNEFYHMVSIIDNILYDKDDKSLELYVIKIYKKNEEVRK